jgi:hypothetical protein
MTDFNYTPDEEIAIHRIGAIRQICRPFLSHENGLPEWVKNSTAAYLRENRPEEQRVIIIFFTNKRRSSPASIACLDFVGMTSEQIERDFRHWADPDAATRSCRTDISIGELGGHGNGGKCYMTHMFEDYSLLYTVRNGRGCRYGVKGGSVAFGYVPNKESGKDFRVDNISAEIDKCLESLRTEPSRLPEAVGDVAGHATGFTFVSGVNPRDCDGRILILSLVESLLVHHQMITPLQQCNIYVVADGHIYNNGRPLCLPEIEPMPGFEAPRIIAIPANLKDPVTQRDVATINNSWPSTGELKIYTSEKNMRFGRSERRQWRHTVNFRTSHSGCIGKISMTHLDVESNYVNYLYCDCHLDALDPYQKNERRELVDSLLTKSVENWISGQVREYCREFEARDRREIGQRDREQLSRINEWLDRWKNQFMSEFMQGLYGGGGVEPTPPLPSGKPNVIQISTTYSKCGLGIYLRPNIKFYDSLDRRIRPVPYHWVSEDNNVAMVDDDLMQIRTFSPGTTTVYAETLDGKVRSNHISLEVVKIRQIRVVPPEVELPAGSKSHLEAICQLSNGEETSGICLTWLEDDSSVARVSSSGMIYAVKPGQTKVGALDESCRSDAPATIIVTEGEGTERGERKGKGYPLVLVSEIDHAPGEDQPAVFRSDEPPVMQRPQDVERNIWWINLASPFALFYRMGRDYGPTSEAWRMYHVERYIDIIVQIALTMGPESQETYASDDWITRAGEYEAEIRKKAMESLEHFIRSGELCYE